MKLKFSKIYYHGCNILAIINLLMVFSAVSTVINGKELSMRILSGLVGILNIYVFVRVFKDGFFLRYFCYCYNLFKAQWAYEKLIDHLEEAREKQLKEEIERLINEAQT